MHKFLILVICHLEDPHATNPGTLVIHVTGVSDAFISPRIYTLYMLYNLYGYHRHLLTTIMMVFAFGIYKRKDYHDIILKSDRITIPLRGTVSGD